MKIGQLYVVLVFAMVILLQSWGVACQSAPNTTNGTVAGTGDDTPPVIEALNVCDITESSATISWRTDEEATSHVQYGKIEQGLARESKSQKLTTDHVITLKGLNAGTSYNFRVSSKDANGNESVSGLDKFMTLRSVGCAIGNRAPDFTLKDINGKDVSLSDFPGKVVIINFWYTTCPPCVAELSYLEKAFSNCPIEEKPVLLTVNNREKARDVRMWMATNQYTLPTLFDQKGEVAKKYCVPFFPMTFFIATDGTIQDIKLGSFASCKEIEDTVNDLNTTPKTIQVPVVTSELAQIPMFRRDPKNGTFVPDAGMLECNLTGSTFDYALNAHGLKSNTDYSLTYYAPVGPKKHTATLIGSAIADTQGDILLAGSIDLEMNLPDEKDINYPTGAMILLVLSEDYNHKSKKITFSHLSEYLYPTYWITYTDTDIP